VITETNIKVMIDKWHTSINIINDACFKGWFCMQTVLKPTVTSKTILYIWIFNFYFIYLFELCTHANKKGMLPASLSELKIKKLSKSNGLIWIGFTITIMKEGLFVRLSWKTFKVLLKTKDLWIENFQLYLLAQLELFDYLIW